MPLMARAFFGHVAQARARRAQICSLAIAVLSITAASRIEAQEVAEPDIVRLVQQVLNAYDLNAGPLDGVIGPQTRDAIRRFEGAAGLPVDGVLDPEAALMILRAAHRVPPVGRGPPVMEWEGETFTLRDVERRCEVWRWSDSWGDVECRAGVWENAVENGCDVWFPSSDSAGELDCDQGEFRLIERHCHAELYSEDYAEISC